MRPAGRQVVRVVLFGTFDSAKNPRPAVLTAGLRQLGNGVAVCNAPVGFDSTMRVAMMRKPWRVMLFLLRLMWSWSLLVIRGRKFRHADAVVIGWMGYLDVHLARLMFPRSLLVLDHLTSLEETAADRGIARGAMVQLMKRLDASALRKADVVCVDTSEHLGDVPAWAAGKSTEVWVGAEDEWFRRPSPSGAGALQVVFFGLYTPLQGTTVIAEALATLIDWPIEVTMIGTGQEFSAARSASGRSPNIRWIDWLPPAALRATVFRHDLSLGIFGTTRKALRVVPNKVFQGAAAGCAIVTSDTLPQRRVMGDAACYVPAGNPEALAAVLRVLCSDRERVDALKMSAYRRADRHFRPVRMAEQLMPFLLARDAR